MDLRPKYAKKTLLKTKNLGINPIRLQTCPNLALREKNRSSIIDESKNWSQSPSPFLEPDTLMLLPQTIMHATYGAQRRKRDFLVPSANF